MVSQNMTAQDLPKEERTVCEVWTRCMGYHRPTKNFNIGKAQEYKDRKEFSMDKTFKK